MRQIFNNMVKILQDFDNFWNIMKEICKEMFHN